MGKEEILQNTHNGLDIYEYVLKRHGYPKELNASKNSGIKNPFYDDKNGSLSIFRDNTSGIYLFNDFGNTSYSGDPFDFYAHHLGLDCKSNFKEILTDMRNTFTHNGNINGMQAANAFGSHISNSKPLNNTTSNPIEKVDLQESSEHWTYWQTKFPSIDKIEEKAKEFSLKSLSSLKSGKLHLESSRSNPLFAFQTGPDCYKTYQPSIDSISKSKHLWINKANEDFTHFLNLIVPGKPCIITEGYKDAFSAYAHGFNVFPLDNAQSMLSMEVIQELSEKGCEIIYCFDNDDAGKTGLVKNAENHPAKYIEIPKLINNNPLKDISDLLSLTEGQTKFEILIKKAKHTNILDKDLQSLFKTAEQMENKSKQTIQWDQPLISFGDHGAIFPDTLTIIQGSFGTHKSRLAEIIAATFIGQDQNHNSIFKRTEKETLNIYYIDTERNQKDQAPFALQQIKKMAGFGIESEIPELSFFSFILIERAKRFDIIVKLIESLLYDKSKHAVIIIDLITDLMLDFNNPQESMKIIDLINKLINAKNITLIGVIHTNPGGEKARGHVGTELVNKASLAINLRTEGDLIEMKCIKSRSTQKFSPIGLMYDTDLKTLIITDEIIQEKARTKSNPSAPIEGILNFMKTLDPEQTYDTGEITKTLQGMYSVSKRTIENRLSEIRKENYEVPFVSGTRKVVSREKGKISFELIQQHPQTQIPL